ncbi:MAG: class I SAM-dependent methyltransferase [Hyphomicrobiales bacterium]
MSFSAEWLALREPIDHAARNDDIINALNILFEGKKTIRLTDIGSGTGSTIRALTPTLESAIAWHLVDNDPALLNIAQKEAAGADVITSHADLSLSLDAIFSQPTDLITTSAFLDLVSEDWISGFVDAVVERRLPFYAALNYDGRAGALPPLTDDEIILAAFNTHQKTDKGLGPALGPDAAHTAMACFEKAGYEITHGLSDWQAGPDHAAFQKMLLDGWRGAASEIRPDLKTDFDDWFAKRLSLIEEADTTGASVFVGHIDFLALP